MEREPNSEDGIIKAGRFSQVKKSQEVAKKLIKVAKKVIKKQFDKKRQNPQGLKKEDNVWLEAKNIYLN